MPHPATHAATQPDAHAMQCMEVWGGFGTVDTGVMMPGVDAWVFGIPYKQAAEGGDVHLASSCGTGRITRMLLADVSGHGVKVAAIASQLRGLMRRYVNHIEQGEFLARTNREFTELATEGLFATAVALTYFAPTGTLSIARAGHPRPLLYSKKRDTWRLMTEDADRADGAPSGLPLGVLAESTFPAVKLRTQPGDLVVLYSDALIEARLKNGTMLGSDGLLAVAQSLTDLPGPQLAEGLYKRVLELTGESHLDDDVTIVVLRPNGERTQAPFIQRAIAGVKFLAQLAASAFGGPTPPWPERSRANVLGAIIPAFARQPLENAAEI